MALPRGFLLVIGVIALGAAGGAGWVLLSDRPPAPVPPSGTGGERPPAQPETVPEGDSSPLAPRPEPVEEDDAPDDMADLDRDPHGPEGGATTQEILDAAAQGNWLEVERLLSIAGSDDPRITKLLLDGLNDDRWRNHVAELARFLKDPAALASFLELARGEGSNLTRAAALKAASYIGGPGVLEAAGDLLRSEKPGSFLSGEAAMALGRLGTPEAARQLVELLKERTGGPYAASVVQALASVRSPEALAALGELAMDPASDPQYRVAILRALGQTGQPSVVNDLLRACRDQEDEEVRNAAYQALGRIGTPEAVQELLSVVHGADNALRYEAAQALQNTGSAAARPLLEQALQGPVDPVIKPFLVTALGRTGGKSSLDVLGKIATDDTGESGLRGTAVKAMGQIGEGSAAPVIVKVLQDTPLQDRSLRDSCLWALQRVATTAELPQLERILEGTPKDTTEHLHLTAIVQRLKREASGSGGISGSTPSRAAPR